MTRSLIAALALFSLPLTACRHAAPSGEQQMANWNARHPDAARDLCVWVQNHPAASQHFFQWDSDHPERAREFVIWTAEHPGEGINAFVATHGAWSEWDWISETHHPAANAFMAWVRKHPNAARDLVNHPAGERWASHHFGC